MPSGRRLLSGVGQALGARFPLLQWVKAEGERRCVESLDA
jgi:hypothetical protein